MVSLPQWWVPIWEVSDLLSDCALTLLNKMIDFLLFCTICKLVIAYCLNNKMSILFCLLKVISGILSITTIICLISIRNLNYLATTEYMGYIFHGCALRYLNDTNVIIWWHKKCLTPTNQSCWKDPKNIINVVKTRSQLKKQPIAHYKITDKYFEQRVNKIIKDQPTNFEEKAIEIINGDQKRTKKELLIFLLLFCLRWTFIFIVNNGNILSDNRRKYLKQSEM